MTKERLKKFEQWLILNGCSSLVYLPKIKELLNITSNLSEDIINNFIFNKRQEGLSSETLNIYLKSIKAYLKFNKEEFSIPKYFKPPKKLPDFFTLEFLEKEILPIIKDLFSKDELRIRILLLFMFYTGLRKSEMYLLKRKDFNFDKKELKVYIPKTKEERLIPLNDKIMKLLKEYFNLESEINNAFNLGAGSIDYIFNLLKPNFPEIKLRPHLFRHSFATHLLNKKFNIREVSSLLGHKNIETTMRYLGLDIDNIKQRFNEI